MLKIEGMKKLYRDFSLKVSMQIQKGSVVGLIGPNGAGKSTCFKAILGLIHLDGGRVQLFGTDSDQLNVKDKNAIGVVFSDSGFSGYLTVKDVEAILRGFYREFDVDYYRSLLDRFGVPTNKKLKEFSTGTRAKLKVIAAISHRPKFLILDEPTAGLDVVARDEILELLRLFMEEDEERSILISSHISSDLENICDDIYMVNEGKIVLHEDTDELISNYGILKAADGQYDSLDQQYLLRRMRESFGWNCLTNQRAYYMENYPDIVVEKATIDDVIMLMIRGEKIL